MFWVWSIPKYAPLAAEICETFNYLFESKEMVSLQNICLPNSADSLIDPVKNAKCYLKYTLKARIDFTPRQDVLDSADLAAVSKLCLV